MKNPPINILEYRVDCANMCDGDFPDHIIREINADDGHSWLITAQEVLHPTFESEVAE